MSRQSRSVLRLIHSLPRPPTSWTTRALGRFDRRVLHFRQWIVDFPWWAWAGIGGGVGYVAWHVEEVPQSGRPRFMISSISLERKLADKTFATFLTSYGSSMLSVEDPRVRYVQALVDRLVHSMDPPVGRQPQEAWDLRKLEYTVYIVDDKEKRKLVVLDNGKILLTTGTIPLAGNETGMVSLLSHEIAHQVLRHQGERMSSMILFIMLSKIPGLFGIDLMPSINSFAKLLPKHYKQEVEADVQALQILASSCYLPQPYPSYWSSLPPPISTTDYLSDHPLSSRRTNAVAINMPAAIKRRYGCCGMEESAVRRMKREGGWWAV